MTRKIAIITGIVLTLAMAFGLTACGGGYDSDALHINYSAEENYGTDDYLGTTLTIAGTGVESETQFTVQELEELAAEDETLQYQGDYSMMSRGGVFSYHEFTGIRLYELLQKCGLKDNLPEDTPVRFVSVDGYALTMELGEIMESSDCTFAAKTDNQPSEENVPKILAFGSDGLPLTGTVGDMKLGEKISEEDGYVDEAENEGGPIRLISGQKTVGEFNAPDNAKWLRQIIVGEDDNAKAHSDALAAEQALRANDTVKVDLESGIWDHKAKPYDRYLDSKLKITGSEAKAVTYTLKDIEEMQDITVADSFGASCGVFGFRGVTLKDLVMDNLADGVDRPSRITVIGQDGYQTEVDVNDMLNGVDSRYQNGEKRDIIIAYAMNGSPLVKNKKSEGFTGENGFGPFRLVVENQTTRWVKNAVEIRIGE
ncbi:MAG: molybdopterin-dependent oxidoreductase [Eubacteriales bacterium]|nr:molybdopterin-dependent oxidoreductase [Eubacteriales bacterium]